MKFKTTRICSAIVQNLKNALDEYAKENGIVIDPESTVRQLNMTDTSALKLHKPSPLQAFTSSRQRTEDLTKLHYAILATHLHYDAYITNIQVMLKSVTKGISSWYSKDGSTLKKGIRRKIEETNRRAIEFYENDFVFLRNMIGKCIHGIVATAEDKPQALNHIQAKLKEFCTVTLRRNQRIELLFSPKHIKREGFPDTSKHEQTYAGYLIQGLLLREIRTFEEFKDVVDLEIKIATAQKNILDKVMPSNMEFVEITQFKKMLDARLEEVETEYRQAHLKRQVQQKALTASAKAPKPLPVKREPTTQELERAEALYTQAEKLQAQKAHEYARQKLEEAGELLDDWMSAKHHALFVEIYKSCFEIETADIQLRKNYIKKGLTHAKALHDKLVDDEPKSKAHASLVELAEEYGAHLVKIALQLPILSEDENPWENVIGSTMAKNPIFMDHILCDSKDEQRLIEQLAQDCTAKLHGVDEKTSKDDLISRLQGAGNQALNIWIRVIASQSSSEEVGQNKLLSLRDSSDIIDDIEHREKTEFLHQLQTQTLMSYQKGRSDTLYMIFYSSISTFINDLFDSYILAKKGAMRRPEDPVDQVNDYVRGAFTHGRAMLGPEVSLTLLGANKLIDWWQDSAYESRGRNFLYTAASKEEVAQHLIVFKTYLKETYAEALKYVDPEGIIDIINAAKERIVEYTGRRQHTSPPAKVWLDALVLGESKTYDHLSVPLQYTEFGMTRKDQMRVTEFLKHPEEVSKTLANSFHLQINGEQPGQKANITML